MSSHAAPFSLVSAVLRESGEQVLQAMNGLKDKRAIRIGDAFYVESDGALFVVFEFGVVVGWNVASVAFLQGLKGMSLHRDTEEGEMEHYSYHVQSDAHVSISEDLVCIPDMQPKTLVAVSHALAQSAVLGRFEERVEGMLTNHQDLAVQLSESGKINLSRRKMAKLRGRLFRDKSDILLHFNLLDIPEFFWHNPEFEPAYLSVAKYLEVTPRVELLKLRLETVQELLDILAGEQNHKHSAFLEWIIIYLIAFDIILYFLGAK